MASVHDVASYILKSSGRMSSMKLQKLVYYSQAWHLVWDEEPLFPETIQAWANGPVVYELFDRHRGAFSVAPPWGKGSSSNLTRSERETIDAVLSEYGKLDGRQLSALTHDEEPWREARAGLSATDRSNRAISLDTMQQFYGGLAQDENASAVGDLPW